eukprot:Skav234442  [mRNA]  locus=scaffold1647:25332:28722:+ [translate_table: standard]
METIAPWKQWAVDKDMEEQEQLSRWQRTSPENWQHVSGETTTTDPAVEINACSQCKRLGLTKLQNARYLAELLLLEPPALPAPKKERDPTYMAKAIQWFMSVDDGSSCTPTPPATARSHVGEGLRSESDLKASPAREVAPSQASQCRGDVETDPVASDMDMAMASDGLMTFCLSEKATAGGATKTAPRDDEKDGSRGNVKDCAEVAEAFDALKPSASSEDLRSEGSGAEVAQLVQAIATAMEPSAGLLLDS